ncbi:hypothetical protein AURDEDRAFT_117155 [Auricularia subglabra TFB-10046 SS5]|nr:hypothetical protein AURDEDRAFT_117155 [Auricularia subglabra TFB-10046 SS5]
MGTPLTFFSPSQVPGITKAAASQPYFWRQNESIPGHRSPHLCFMHGRNNMLAGSRLKTCLAHVALRTTSNSFRPDVSRAVKLS